MATLFSQSVQQTLEEPIPIATPTKEKRKSAGASLIAPDQVKQNTTFLSIISMIIINSIPAMIYLISWQAILMINLHYIGNLGNSLDVTYLLDAVGIGGTLLNCTTNAIIVGLNFGFVALSSQAFGAKNFKLVGNYFHRALIVNSLVILCCYILLLFAEKLFLVLNMPEQTAGYAQQYITSMFGGLYLYLLLDTLKSYLMVQGIFYPQLVAQLIAATAHWFWCDLFINQLEMKIEGVAIATTITYGTAAILIFLYIIIFKPYPQTWFFFNKESFQGLKSLFLREVPIGSMLYLEWIAFEITILMASSYLPNQTGGQITFYGLSGIFFVSAMGLSMTVTTFVGQAMGDGNIQNAKRILMAGGIMMTILITINTSALAVFSDKLFYFFTSNEDIIAEAKSIMVIYYYIIPGDYGQCLLGGFVRAIGKEKQGFWVFLVCLYVIALPICYILGDVYGMNVIGIRIGLLVGLYALFVSDIVIIFMTDLKSQVKMIEERIQQDLNESNSRDPETAKNTSIKGNKVIESFIKTNEQVEEQPSNTEALLKEDEQNNEEQK